MAQDHQPYNSPRTEAEEGPVLTTTEARQGKNYGVWRILAISLALAVAAGVTFLAAGFQI